MGIVNRIKQILTSNVNAGLDKIENPDNVMNQAVIDLGLSISNMNNNLVDITATRLGLEKSVVDLKEQAKYWDSLCASDTTDPEVTQNLSALNNRNRVLADVKKYMKQIHDLYEEESTIKSELSSAKLELTNLKNKKALLSAKYNLAKNSKERDKVSDKYNPQGIYQTMERMEEKIEGSSNQVKARRMVNSSEPDLQYATMDYDSLMNDIKSEK